MSDRPPVFLRLALLVLVLALTLMVLVPGVRDAPPSTPESDSPAGEVDPAAADGPGGTAAAAPIASGAGVGGNSRAELDSPGLGPPPEGDSVFVIGRVVDLRRQPVAGVEVTSHHPGRVPVRTTADATGRFRLGPFPRPEREGEVWWLLASAGPTAGWERGWIAAREPEADSLGPPPPPLRGEVELRPIVLGPAAPVRVIVESGGGPAAGASVLARTAAAGIPAGQAETGAGGRVEFQALPLGPFHLEARAGGLLARYSGILEPAGAEITLSLRPGRTVEIQVLDDADGSPVSGAKVELRERLLPSQSGVIRMGFRRTPSSHPLPIEILPTDPGGRTLLRGLPSEGNLTAWVSAAGYGTRSGPFFRDSVGVRIPAGATLVQVELSKIGRRTVVWPVTVRELDPPPEGAELELVKRPGSMEGPAGPIRGRMLGGQVVVEEVPSFGLDCLAIAPDGSRARLYIEGEAAEGRKTFFWRPRTLRVRLFDQAGNPASGWRVEVRNQGNNHEARSRPIGEDGLALLEGLPQQLVEASAIPPQGEPDGDLPIGTADLRQADAVLEATIPNLAEIQVEMLLDGLPGLPARFRLAADGRHAEILSEDPERGTLRARAWLDSAAEETRIVVRAEGFQGGKSTVPIAQLLGGSPARLELSSTASLVCSVLREQETRVELRLHRYSDQNGAWEMVRMQELGAPNLPDGRFSFEGLVAGRYRVRDAFSGLASGEVDVRPLGAPAEVELDLLSLRTISGHLELPEGFPIYDCRILVEGTGLDFTSWRRNFLFGWPENGLKLSQDGSFSFRLPVDRGVVLRPWHPVLQPAPPAEGGEAILAQSSGDIVLRLVEGPTTAIPLSPELVEAAAYGSLPVRLYRGPPQGEGVYLARAPIVDGQLRFGGYRPGRYTVWIDVERSFVPVVYQDVELGEGETLLPAAVARAGSRIRVRLNVAAGQDAPRIYVSATLSGPPRWNRQLNSRGEEEVVLSGLGAGSWKVVVGVVMGRSGRLFDGTLDLTEGEERILDLEIH